MEEDTPPTIVGGISNNNNNNNSSFITKPIPTIGSGSSDDDNCSVRVALRVRPLSSKEITERSEEVVRYVDGVPQVIIGKDQTFTFDYVFSGKSKQHQVYDDCVTSLVDSMFQGYNSTILAYGQTGSGKTYTMGSTSTVGVAIDELGVIPRVIGSVFDRVDRLKSTHSIVVKVSFLELYNEEIRDMLNPDSSTGGLNIRETSSGEVHIPGLFEEVVRSRSQMEDALIRGSQSRTIGSTLMNVHSSRSHAIFTVIIEQTILDQTGNEENNISEERNPTIRSKFHFVDLAGSERVKKTKAEGQRLKEGININSGLLALGNVISALGDTRRTAKPKHVPYRDSKLTRMLQSSLGGNSRTLMIACISPADSNFEETLNTLKYAYRARNIMNKPVVNVDPLTKQINLYRGQIQILRDELMLKLNYKDSDIDALLQDVNIDISIGGGVDHEQIGGVGGKSNGSSAASSYTTTSSSSSAASSATNNSLNDKKEPPLTPSRSHLPANTQTQFEDSMKISQLEFENNMLQEISNKVTKKYKVLLGRFKQLEEASYGFVNSFSPNKESAEYLELFNQFQKILVEKGDVDTTVIQDEQQQQQQSQQQSQPQPSEEEDIESIENVTEMMDENEKLSDLNDYIVAKEEELELIAKSQMQYQQMKEMYDNRMKELEVQLTEMKEERENVMKSLEEKQKSVSDGGAAYEEEKTRLTNYYEKKLAELKRQLDQHTRSIKDHQRLMDLKNKSDEKIVDLNEDIKDLKRQKSDILKRMRDELKKRDDQKQTQNKELEALKKEAKKSEQLIGQLMNQSKKKDQLLQKKIDESEVIKKKLKDLESNKRVISGGAIIYNNSNNNKPNNNNNKLMNNNNSSSNNNNSGFRSKVVSSNSNSNNSKPHQFSVPNWRDWLLEQIRKNLSKNEMTETLDKHLGEKDLFVRESARLKQQQMNNKMTRAEYQEQSSFLEMNIKQQNEKIARVQKDLASMANDYMDSTEIMRKVSTTPYEKLPHLIQASFELCVEYAEQNRTKRVTDQFEQRTKSSTLLDGIKFAKNEYYKQQQQQQQTQSPIIESKEINSLGGSGGNITISAKLKDIQPISSSNNNNNVNTNTKSKSSISSTTTITTTTTNTTPTLQTNIQEKDNISFSTITSSAPTPTPTTKSSSSFSTADFIKEIELLQQQIRQSSLNFVPPVNSTIDHDETIVDNLASIDNNNNLTTNIQQPTILVTPTEITPINNKILSSPPQSATAASSPQSTTTTSVVSKVDQLLDDLKSSKERSKNRQKIRKHLPTSTTNNSQPTISALLENHNNNNNNSNSGFISNNNNNNNSNSGFTNNNNNLNSDSPIFDNSVLDVDIDLIKKPTPQQSSPKSRKALQSSGDNVILSPNSANAYLSIDGDVFARLSAPRPDSRLRRYRDKLKTDNYRTAILQTRRQELNAGNNNDASADTFIKCNWTFTGHEGSIHGLLFNDQSQQLYSCGQDKLVKAWDLVSGDCVSDLTGHTAAVKAMAYHPLTGLLFSGGSSDRSVRVWDMRTSQSGVVQSIKVQNELLCMSSHGHYIFGGLENCTIKVWDTRQLRPVKTPLSKRENLSGSVFSMTFSSKHFVTGSRDHSVTLYHKDNLEMVQRLQPHHLDGVNALCVGADDIIYSGSRDRTIKRWEPVGQQYQQGRLTNTNHQDWVTSLTSHNSMIFSGCRDATIKGWDAQLSSNTMHLLGHESSVNCIISTGNVLLSGSSDRSIKLWKV